MQHLPHIAPSYIYMYDYMYTTTIYIYIYRYIWLLRHDFERLGYVGIVGIPTSPLFFRFAPLNKRSMTHGFPWIPMDCSAPEAAGTKNKKIHLLHFTEVHSIQLGFPHFFGGNSTGNSTRKQLSAKVHCGICSVFFQVVWSAGAAGAVRAIWTATRGWPGTQEIPGKLWETIWVLVETSQEKLMVWKDVWQENPCLKDFWTGNSGKRTLAGENTWFTASFVLNIPTSLHPHCNWDNRNV